MSKINQIQKALLELDGGAFQKLADAYLMAKGFGHINSIGSVVAKNKVRTGTPDTLITTPQGNYIFGEHTTQEKNFFGKMKDDLNKCFNEDKTGIPIGKIERVIFCFTETIGAEKQHELAEICRVHGVNLDLFGIDTLSFDLYENYPGLALEFLGVNIDTGQIVSPEQFISLYNNGKLATRLDLGFHFREEELSRLLDSLETKQLVIVSGRPGVGKSRLSLEACRKFNETHTEYEVFCIFGRNQDLLSDMQVQFSRPGSFLILVDDANRVNRFEYITDLIQHQSESQQIKVIVTVRDYALNKVREVSRSLADVSELILDPLTDKQIKELISEEYGICNTHYLERIADISGGNPRLAVMAAEVAKDRPLHSIYDVSALYDSYFASIQGDLGAEGADIGRADLLKTAAIVSFFKSVDCSNNEMMELIQQAFNISPAVLWEAAQRLHELEILDMYENEVVRVSDQVLGTYLFYLAYFKEKTLNFGELIRCFFPKYRDRIIDSINPVLSAFDSQNVIDEMRPHIDKIWGEMSDSGDEKSLINLIDAFWFVKRTDTLIWIRDRIDECEQESKDISDVVFEKSPSAVPTPSILSVLRSFAFVEEDEARMAVDLILRYIDKRPSETRHLLRIFIDDYGFKPDSYLHEYKIQSVVINAISKRLDNESSLFYCIFLAAANDYLSTHFESTESKGMEILFRRFDLSATPELLALRKVIWGQLFEIYNTGNLQEEILEIIACYSSSPNKLNSSNIVKDDASYVLPFLESVLDPNNYDHCCLMQGYLDRLESRKIDIPEDCRSRFRNNVYVLAKVLLPERGEGCDKALSYEEYQEYKKSKLEQYTANYTLDDFVLFFDDCYTIKHSISSGKSNNDYQLQQGVRLVLLALAENDSNLFLDVIARYLKGGDQLRLDGYFLVQSIVQLQGYGRAVSLFNEFNFPAKRKWLFYIHEAIEGDAVNESGLANLYRLYDEAQREDLPYNIDYLLKYLPADSQVFIKVVTKVLDKAVDDPNIIYSLGMLFNSYSEITKQLSVLFSGEIDLLKRAYYAVEGMRDHSDHDGFVFNNLLDLDPSFITEYISWKYTNSESGWLSSHDNPRDFSFIWKRPDYQVLMNRVTECVYTFERDSFGSIAPYLESFFQIRDGSDANGDVRERQDTYLLYIIDQQSDDEGFMKLLFSVISKLAVNRRLKCIEKLIQRNVNFEMFESLSLEPRLWHSKGSWVPVLQKQINYWQSILPLMNTVDLLSHKQYVENNINALQKRLEQEKKSDFISD